MPKMKSDLQGNHSQNHNIFYFENTFLPKN